MLHELIELAVAAEWFVMLAAALLGLSLVLESAFALIGAVLSQPNPLYDEDYQRRAAEWLSELISEPENRSTPADPELVAQISEQLRSVLKR